MHGDKDIGLVYGLEMLLFGFGGTIAPPIAGKTPLIISDGEILEYKIYTTYRGSIV